MSPVCRIGLERASSDRLVEHSVYIDPFGGYRSRLQGLTSSSREDQSLERGPGSGLPVPFWDSPTVDSGSDTGSGHQVPGTPQFE